MARSRSNGAGRPLTLLLGGAISACVATSGEVESLGGAVTVGAETGGSESGSTGESGDSTTAIGSSEDGTANDESTGGAEPPFFCDAAPSRPMHIDGEVFFEPAEPHPGDTLSVIVRATNGTSRTDAPPMDLEITDRDGLRIVSPLTIQGGDALYYYAIADVPEGDLCLRGIVDGLTEVSSRIEVTPRPPSPPADQGVYKIIRNHQWTCDEQPGNGNELHVWVRDERGQGQEGVAVALRPVDSTDPESIYNGESEALPTEIVTGPDGHGMVFNYWPISEHGLMTFRLFVDGVASDIATEVTTGWWETSPGECNYCNTPTVNVWGHWSYTVEFQRDPSATQICVVPTDHAGMSACDDYVHIHHDPSAESCWPL